MPPKKTTRGMNSPLKTRETEGSVAVVAVVAVILKPITATTAAPSAAKAREVECDVTLTGPNASI